jgi:hypothetical protein
MIFPFAREAWELGHLLVVFRERENHCHIVVTNEQRNVGRQDRDPLLIVH